MCDTEHTSNSISSELKTIAVAEAVGVHRTGEQEETRRQAQTSAALSPSGASLAGQGLGSFSHLALHEWKP